MLGEVLSDSGRLASLPFDATTPGRYYLASNITGLAGEDGIRVKADYVWLEGLTVRDQDGVVQAEHVIVIGVRSIGAGGGSSGKKQ